ncbi:MAG: type IV secretory system conjugative DNA transfer family protein [Flavobacteriales bacterium]
MQNPSDIAKISSMLIRTSNSKSDFWTLKSEELLTIMIAFVKNHQPKVHQNLANVYHLLEHLQSEPQTVETLFKENANETLNLKLQGILKNSENTKASIISATLSTLSFIGNDENLQHITSVDTIDFDRFRKEKTVLFLRCPLGDSEYYKKIISLFFEQFFSTVFNKALPDKEDLHISVIADELGSLYLPNLPSIISNARKFKIPILGVLQSENQLFENYGSYNAKTILNNAGVKIYFTGLTDESEKLERVLGKFEYKDDKERIRTRSLMTSDEIRTMPKRNILIIPSGRKPLKVKTTPYYEQAKLKKWIDGDVHIDSHIPSQDYLDKPKQHHQIYKAILLDLSPYKAKQTQLQDVDANFIKIPKYGR